MSIDLSRYLDFQKRNYTKVYLDIRNKKYDSGWIEYVLPRMEVQCDSPRSYGTGLKDKREVNKFWNNKLLKNNYINIIKLLNKYTLEEYKSILSERGRYKINQSIDLFLPLAKENDFQLLDSFKAKFGNT